MKKLNYLFLTILILFGAIPSFAQEGEQPIDVFGYFQNHFQYFLKSDVTNARNSFALGQLNLFLSKDLGSDFSSLVNLEFTTNYQSDKNFGTLKIEEGWVKYSPSATFNIKAGLLIPRFNNLNEIKNKTPLLPYIMRPIIFEAQFSQIWNFEAYLPSKSFLQIYGDIPVSDLKFDYTLFFGNAESPYYSKGTGTSVGGMDTSTFKAIGGRLGFSWNSLKAGVSTALDRENKRSFGLGDLPRTKLGFYVSYNIAGISLDAEYIKSTDQASSDKQIVLDNYAKVTPLGNRLERTFYYGNLSYDVNDKIFCFANYAYVEDLSVKAFAAGATQTMAGVGYHFTDKITGKFQYAHLLAGDTKLFPVDMQGFLLGISVFY